ncbi:MAG: hypothetical protein HKM92_02780 [Arenibacter sp.]|nr:hypothetical protein [Arenibacter sp.]
MLPLIKKGMEIEYRLGKKSYKGKVFNARKDIIWLEDKTGKITRIHKKYHNVKIAEKVSKGKEGGEKPKKPLDDLFSKLSKG